MPAGLEVHTRLMGSAAHMNKGARQTEICQAARNLTGVDAETLKIEGRVHLVQMRCTLCRHTKTPQIVLCTKALYLCLDSVVDMDVIVSPVVTKHFLSNLQVHSHLWALMRRMRSPASVTPPRDRPCTTCAHTHTGGNVTHLSPKYLYC